MNKERKPPEEPEPVSGSDPGSELDGAGQGYSIKGFMLTAVLVLPMAFFIWFYLSSLLVMPTSWLFEGLLRMVIGEPFHDISRNVYQLNVELFINPPPGISGSGQAVAAIPLNPMIYGYGLALAGGLIFCIPLTWLRRAIQLVSIFVSVTLVQTWGCFWELLKDLSIKQVLGPEGIAMVADAGISNEVVGFAYQFGYLVLPAVVPVVAWIIMNRQFIEGLVQPGVFGPRR